MGLLSLAIWVPIAFGAVLLAFGREEHAKGVRWVALVGAIVSFLVTVPLFTRSVMTSQAEMTTTTVMNAVSSTSHSEMPSTPRW